MNYFYIGLFIGLGLIAANLVIGFGAIIIAALWKWILVAIAVLIVIWFSIGIWEITQPNPQQIKQTQDARYDQAIAKLQQLDK
jgi:CHASE2 domain-containing sensor protein